MSNEHQIRLANFITDALWCNGKIKCADVVIALPCGQFTGHKLVLGAQSRSLSDIYLRDPELSFYDLRTNQYNYITRAAFSKVMEYMYTGRIDLTGPDVREIHRIANDFVIVGLLSMLSDAMSRGLIGTGTGYDTGTGTGALQPKKSVPKMFDDGGAADDAHFQKFADLKIQKFEREFDNFPSQGYNLPGGGKPPTDGGIPILSKQLSMPQISVPQFQNVQRGDGFGFKPGQGTNKGLETSFCSTCLVPIPNLYQPGGVINQAPAVMMPIQTYQQPVPIQTIQSKPFQQPYFEPSQPTTYPTAMIPTYQQSPLIQTIQSQPFQPQYVEPPQPNLYSTAMIPTYQQPPPIQTIQSQPFQQFVEPVQPSIYPPTMYGVGSPQGAANYPQMSQIVPYVPPPQAQYAPPPQAQYFPPPQAQYAPPPQAQYAPPQPQYVPPPPAQSPVSPPPFSLMGGPEVGLRPRYAHLSADDFLNLKLEEVCAILRDDWLAIENEVEALIAAWRWIHHARFKRWHNIRTVMACIRFHHMSARQLIMSGREMESITEVHDFLLDACWYHTCLQLGCLDLVVSKVPDVRKFYGTQINDPFSIYRELQGQRYVPTLPDFRNFMANRMMVQQPMITGNDDESAIADIMNKIRQDSDFQYARSSVVMGKVIDMYNDIRGSRGEPEMERKEESPLNITNALRKLRMSVQELMEIMTTLDTTTRASVMRVSMKAPPPDIPISYKGRKMISPIKEESETDVSSSDVTTGKSTSHLTSGVSSEDIPKKKGSPNKLKKGVSTTDQVSTSEVEISKKKKDEKKDTLVDKKEKGGKKKSKEHTSTEDVKSEKKGSGAKEESKAGKKEKGKEKEKEKGKDKEKSAGAKKSNADKKEKGHGKGGDKGGDKGGGGKHGKESKGGGGGGGGKKGKGKH